jgi:hypothetical protein
LMASIPTFGPMSPCLSPDEIDQIEN